jgi:hypothetical protein
MADATAAAIRFNRACDKKLQKMQCVIPNVGDESCKGMNCVIPNARVLTSVRRDLAWAWTLILAKAFEITVPAPLVPPPPAPATTAP